MLTAKATSKPYFTLSEPIPGDRIFDLLGRAIVIEQTESLKRPIEAQILPMLPDNGNSEHKGGPDLRQLEPNLYPRTVIEVENVEILLERTHGESAKAAMTKWLNLLYTYDKSEKQTVGSCRFRRITMETQKQRIESLLKKKDYAAPILEFFREYPHGRLGIVVSIISCWNMELGQAGEGNHGSTIGGTVVPSEVTSIPGAGVTLEISHRKKQMNELKGTYKGEVIVACGYISMVLKQPESRWWQWLSPTSWKTPRRSSVSDIDVSVDQMNPKTLKVAAQSRIPGDTETLLGGGLTTTPPARAVVGDTDENDDLDFIIMD